MGSITSIFLSDCEETEKGEGRGADVLEEKLINSSLPEKDGRDRNAELSRGLADDAQVKAWEEEFGTYTEEANLEIYTVFALSCGLHGFWHKRTLKKALAIVCCLLMQLLVPFMMMTFRFDEFRAEHPTHDWRFRTTGFFVYLYSLKNMVENANDPSRECLMNIAVHYPLPWRYVWTVVLGEVVNTFVSVAMMLTLFVNFLGQTHPADLVINAVSLNFLGNFDNEVVYQEWLAEANDDFDVVVERGAQNVRCAYQQHLLVLILRQVLFYLKIIFTALGGVALAFVFLLSKEDLLLDTSCVLFHDHLPWCTE
jgi:hypothetical protein